MAFHSQTTAFNSQVLERKAEWVKWNRQPMQGAKVVLVTGWQLPADWQLRLSMDVLQKPCREEHCYA